MTGLPAYDISATGENERPAAKASWLRQEEEMGRLIANFPWATTPLGPLDTWPPELRLCVNLMLEAAAPMAIVWGPDFRCLYNSGYRDILQDKHPAALGAPAQAVFSELWAEVLPLFRRTLAGNAVVIDDFSVPFTRLGETRPAFFSFSYNPIRNARGEVPGFLAVVVETTARVRHERERASVFDTTLSAIADFAYSFDREGRFIYVNKALLDLWGLQLPQAVGKNFFELNYPPELAARLQRQIEEVFIHHHKVRDETLYVSPSGVEGYYEYIFSPVFGQDGTVIVVAGSTRDITARKKLERDLEEAKNQLEQQAGALETLVAERTARLQDTVSELEAFSYSISHDLRGPLRAMQSFAQALREDCGAQVSEIGQNYIRRIVAAAARMDRIIQDVLVYSRIARTDLALERVDLQEFVPSLLDGYPAFHDQRSDIVVESALPVVRANTAALTQCLANLIGNALKFVAPGVRPVVRISARRESGRAFISIQDNGIGIPKRAHDEIFGVFYRLDPAYEGTGIGLAIVRKAVERMGGHITVTSELQRGSTFTFDLALAEST
jgi:PAS domain S-box-containing protein